MDHSGKRSSKRRYRKTQVADQYGVSGRTIERAVEDGHLPPPNHPLGDKIPDWDGDDLDAHDCNLAARVPRRASEQPKAEDLEATAPAAPKRGRGRPRLGSEALAAAS